ncbi:hypothetical protein vBAbaMPhT2_198 [Acinetobacter phage vB_AbaM_PhT2]|uniref:Uncharacterized protein n=1 Tax=Acinetobacter phage vB_AbaM_PhT2 TaxID=2690230 RepID=A0A6B9SW88_9CAUD|nr:hypothetical protein HYQ24_gp240 [Acinetobacter phage vB_AbaM_PhT2]QHJ75801.1 hypothetical protein vBAbaMPhT2_198 [Acinetobacter phage vB_AbaM_PhT2]
MFDAFPSIVGMFVGLFLIVDSYIELKNFKRDALKLIVGTILLTLTSTLLWLK